MCWLQERGTGEQLPGIVSKVYLTSTYSNLKKKQPEITTKLWQLAKLIKVHSSESLKGLRNIATALKLVINSPEQVCLDP